MTKSIETIQAQRPSAADQQLMNVLDQSPEPIVILHDTEIRFMNTVARRELGYESHADVLGKNILVHVARKHHRLARKRLSAIVKDPSAGKEPQIFEIRNSRGERRRMKVSSVPIHFEGTPAIVAFAQDVTENKTLRAHLLQADRLAAVGTLAAGVAHEINNPLAYMLLNVEYLARRLPELSDPAGEIQDLIERLNEVRHGGERVATIVRDLRTFARGGDDLPSKVDVVDCVESAIKLCEHQIRQRARLRRSYGPVPAVRGSAARLEQVFLNLIVNAVHAIADGAASENEISIEVGVSPEGQVRIEVKDSGCGIPAKTLDRVFDPFFTTKPSGVGTGLGLPICKGIVEHLGGQMAISSTVGVGTCVSIDLLTETGELAPKSVSSTPPVSETRLGGRLLIIDDDRAVADSLRLHLKDTYDVTTVDRGQTALELLLKDGSFDCVLCDVVMPEVSGVDLYERLKQERPELTRRMVFMTGGAFTERAAHFVDQCERPVLRKPFQLAQLHETLQSTIRKSRQHRPRMSGEYEADKPTAPRRGQKKSS